MELTKPRLRVAAIDFLNTAPLVWGLENEARLKLSYTLPSVCADSLRAGAADIGIIPVIEMARIPDLLALPGIAIAASREVRSILLLSRLPVRDVRSVALDRASRTSAALVQVLLHGKYGISPSTQAAADDWRASLNGADAVLVIGDPALKLAISGEAQHQGVATFDLASEWFAWTGLPFVFAVWAVRRESLAVWGNEVEAGAWLANRFERARSEGFENLASIANQWAARLGLKHSEVRHYLEEDVEYELSPHHIAGLQHFFNLAANMGLIESAELPEFVPLAERAGLAG
jgi:chorismate dehydratase